MPDELEQHLPEVISKFEQRENGVFVNARLEREYQRKAAISEARRGNGLKGGRPKAKAKQLLNKRKANLEVGSRKKEVPNRKNGATVSSTSLAFESAEFANAWSAYSRMRNEIRKPLVPTAIQAAMKRLAAMGEPRAIAALEHTTSNQWQGIREPDSPAVSASKPAPKTFAQQRVDNSRIAIDEFCKTGGSNHA